MPNELHVIFGTGPVGCWTARALREANLPVRAVNRSGKRPDLMPADVEIVAANVSNHAAATAAAKGATVVYQALSPPYHQWHEHFIELQTSVIAAGKNAGARYVSIENLYMYDSSGVISEDSLIAPQSKKGELRAWMAEEVMDAHKRGDIRATALRSSDYYGPGVLNSALGERFFGHLVSGKKAQGLGSATLPHSFAYIEDVGRAAATVGTHEEAFGKVWIAPHAPASTQGEIAEVAGQALSIQPQIAIISPLIMRIFGLFAPAARESVEMMYEFTKPFVVDSSCIQSELGLEPTPVRIGIKRTVNWYKGLKANPSS